MDVGRDYGIRNAGYYALRALRTEKFFAYWGTDLGSAITPLECGRDHRVKLAVSNLVFVVLSQGTVRFGHVSCPFKITIMTTPHNWALS